MQQCRWSRRQLRHSVLSDSRTPRHLYECCQQVRVKASHQPLALGVTEADIVLQQLGLSRERMEGRWCGAQNTAGRLLRAINLGSRQAALRGGAHVAASPAQPVFSLTSQAYQELVPHTHLSVFDHEASKEHAPEWDALRHHGLGCAQDELLHDLRWWAAAVPPTAPHTHTRHTRGTSVAG